MIAIMVLLLAITVRVVNERITQQFEVDAKRTLATADAGSSDSNNSGSKTCSSVSNRSQIVPRYKAIFQTGHRDTLRQVLRKPSANRAGMPRCLPVTTENCWPGTGGIRRSP